MIPHLAVEDGLPESVRDFLSDIKGAGFTGDVSVDMATRLVNATDNSIYQCLPQAVLAPRSAEDIGLVMALLAREEYRQLTLTPRGGGTGTNGQALGEGLILDCSKYLNQIRHFSAEEKRVTVEPGVVLDQLNAHLAPHGLLFPPTLSPSNRATLGGMVATDACGKGSRIYGKTSDYITSLTLALPNGETLEIDPVGHEQMARMEGTEKRLHELAADIGQTHRDEITRRFPHLNRELTGYNFNRLYTDDGKLNLNALISGAEGTLGVVTSITFRLIPKPKYSRMVVACYTDFDATLRAAPDLLAFNPLAIETFDGVVYRLALKDTVWHKVAHLMPGGGLAASFRGVNLIEFVGDDEAAVKAKAEQLCDYLEQHRGKDRHAAFWLATDDPQEMQGFWELRKRGVGLLGNMEGEKKPVPFVEDTAVPPEKLADYIRDYRALLDGYGLDYGMFGHVDTGCLHVRPALDLKTWDDEARIREISDAVQALVRRYGGIMWGEHGKGFRAEYTPELLGETLYACQRKVKAAFDPFNQMNPGKIATAEGTELAITPLDAVPMRGQFDREITPAARVIFKKSLECNGNGACFNYAADEAMCPSYKVTRNRIHSPKGRAGLTREWLRLLSNAGYDVETGKTTGNTHAGGEDFSHSVYAAMEGCLGCKACSNTCPIKVDVPELKSRFLNLYHRRYRRPLRDYLVRYTEELAAWMRRSPALSRRLMELPLLKRGMERVIGMVDLPVPDKLTLKKRLKKLGVPHARKVKKVPVTDRTVILLADSLNSTYDTGVLAATAELLQKLGYAPVVFTDFINGKTKHVKGFTAAFRRRVRHNHKILNKLAGLGRPTLGVEASIALTYRQEYPQYLEAGSPPARYHVQLVQEWLAGEITAGHLPSASMGGGWQLFSHCTEQTSIPATTGQWQAIFRHFGMEATPVKTGCCGMAGSYGYETRHRQNSHDLYIMSWKGPIEAAGGTSMATGFSCRCQAKRFSGFRPPHPVEVLAGAVSLNPDRRNPQ